MSGTTCERNERFSDYWFITSRFLSTRLVEFWTCFEFLFVFAYAYINVIQLFFLLLCVQQFFCFILLPNIVCEPGFSNIQEH